MIRVQAGGSELVFLIAAIVNAAVVALLLFWLKPLRRRLFGKG
jgi:hypothetical protein